MFPHLSSTTRTRGLSEYTLDSNCPEADVIRILWDVMDVRELVLSIEASGFFSHEPIIVIQEDGKNVVVEGNRRLAAVKLLLDPGSCSNFECTRAHNS